MLLKLLFLQQKDNTITHLHVRDDTLIVQLMTDATIQCSKSFIHVSKGQVLISIIFRKSALYKFWPVN